MSISILFWQEQVVEHGDRSEELACFEEMCSTMSNKEIYSIFFIRIYQTESKHVCTHVVVYHFLLNEPGFVF